MNNTVTASSANLPSTDNGIVLWPLSTLGSMSCHVVPPTMVMLTDEIHRTITETQTAFRFHRSSLEDLEKALHHLEDQEDENNARVETSENREVPFNFDTASPAASTVRSWFSQPLHRQCHADLAYLYDSLSAPIDVCKSHHSWFVVGEGTYSLLADRLQALSSMQSAGYGASTSDASLLEIESVRDFLFKTIRVNVEQRPFDRFVDVHVRDCSTTATSPEVLALSKNTQQPSNSNATAEADPRRSFCFLTLTPTSIGLVGPRKYRIVDFPKMLCQRMLLHIHTPTADGSGQADGASMSMPLFHDHQLLRSSDVFSGHNYTTLLTATPFLAPEVAATIQRRLATTTTNDDDNAQCDALIHEATHPAADVWSTGVILLQYLMAAGYGKPHVLDVLFTEGRGNAAYPFLKAIGEVLTRRDSQARAPPTSSSTDPLHHHHDHPTGLDGTEPAVVVDTIKYLVSLFSEDKDEERDSHVEELLSTIGSCLTWRPDNRWKQFCETVEVDGWLDDKVSIAGDGQSKEAIDNEEEEEQDPAVAALKAARKQHLSLPHLLSKSNEWTEQVQQLRDSERVLTEALAKKAGKTKKKRTDNDAESQEEEEEDENEDKRESHTADPVQLYRQWRLRIERAAVIESSSANPREVRHESLFEELFDLIIKRGMSDAAATHQQRMAPLPATVSKSEAQRLHQQQRAHFLVQLQCIAEAGRPLLLELYEQAAALHAEGHASLPYQLQQPYDHPMANGDRKNEDLMHLISLTPTRRKMLSYCFYFLDGDTIRSRMANGYTAGSAAGMNALKIDSLDLVYGDSARKARLRGQTQNSNMSCSPTSPMAFKFASLQVRSDGTGSAAVNGKATIAVQDVVGHHEFNAVGQQKHTAALRSKIMTIDLLGSSASSSAKRVELVNDLRRYIDTSLDGCIPAAIRAECWGVLLGVDPIVARTKRYDSIEKFKATCSDRQIAVDIPRCHQYSQLLSSTDGHEKLLRILKTWAVVHTEKGMIYWQGIDSICATLLSITFHDEPLVFACLEKIIDDYVPHFFSEHPMDHRLHVFNHWLAYFDPQLSAHFTELQIRPELFGVPWFLTLFAHVLPLKRIYPLWDAMILSQSRNFPCAVAVSIVIELRQQLLQSDFSACIALLSNAHMMQSLPVHAIAKTATNIFSKLPPSVANPDISSARGALIKTSVCSMIEAGDLEAAVKAAREGKLRNTNRTLKEGPSGVDTVGSWFHDTGLYLLDTRTRDEILGPSAIEAEAEEDGEWEVVREDDAKETDADGKILNEERKDTNQSGAKLSKSLITDWGALGAAGSSSGGGGGNSSKKTASKSSNGRRPLIVGSVATPYDGLDGWNMEDVVTTVLADSSSMLIKPTTTMIDTRPPTPQSSATNRPRIQTSHHPQQQQQPHVVVFAGQEPESGQSAALALIRAGFKHVSCVLGGVDSFKKQAPTMVIL